MATDYRLSTGSGAYKFSFSPTTSGLHIDNSVFSDKLF